MPSEKRERQRTMRYAGRDDALRTAQRTSSRRRTRNIVAAAVLVLAGLFVFSVVTDGDDDETATSDTSVTSSTTAPVTYGTTPCPPDDGSAERTLDFEDSFEQCIEEGQTYTATFDTTEGAVVVELDTDRTPVTANSFVALSRYHYYDDTKLFRTDPSIGIIQGGSPHTQDNSDPGPGYNLQDEGGDFTFDETTGQGTGPFTYEPGQLVMARSAGPDSSGGQFFFTVNADAAALDAQGTYIVFGTVTKGLDVLEKILALHKADPTSGLGGAPERDVTINEVTITAA